MLHLARRRAVPFLPLGGAGGEGGGGGAAATARRAAAAVAANAVEEATERTEASITNRIDDYFGPKANPGSSSADE